MSSRSPLYLCLNRLRRRGAILFLGIILLAALSGAPAAGFSDWTDDGARIDPNG